MSRQDYGGGLAGLPRIGRDPSPMGGSSKPKPSTSRSGSPGVFASMGLANPTLRIQLLEETLYLHPAPQGEPTEDPSVSGSVILWLPKAKYLKSLSVRLLGRQNIGWPDGRPYETSIVLDKIIKLFEEDTLLEKGEHTFAFDIIVPSSTATYERCQHGRVRHTVTAKAKGLGTLGGDIVSEERMLFLIVNPGGAGASSPPPPLQEHIEGTLDEIGPYTVSLRSGHIMVGGLLLFRFHLVSPPSDLVIYSIKVKINQHFLLKSALDDHECAPPIEPRLVLLIDAKHPANFGRVELPTSSGAQSGSQTPQIGPLKILPQGTEYQVSHLARLPNDNIIRPSTQVGTETGINVRHTMSVEMTYRAGVADGVGDRKKGKDQQKERRKLVISRPVDIFSCCCFIDSLTLPVYSLLDPNPEPEANSPPCVCGFSIQEVIKHHGQTLLCEEGEPGITFAPISKDDSGPATPSSADSRGRSHTREFFRANSS